MSNGKEVFLIILTLLIAMILEILPLPMKLLWIQPQWVFVVLVFWISHSPLLVGVGVSFMVGVLLDLLKGTLLGEYAFVFCIISYLLIKFHPHLRSLPMWQQCLMIFLLSMLSLSLRYWIMGLIGWPPFTWSYWLSAITTPIAWPILSGLLNSYGLRYQMD